MIRSFNTGIHETQGLPIIIRALRHVLDQANNHAGMYMYVCHSECKTFIPYNAHIHIGMCVHVKLSNSINDGNTITNINAKSFL